MEGGHILLADLDRQEAVRRIAKSQAEILGLSWNLAIRTGHFARTLVAQGKSAASALISARVYAKDLAQYGDFWA